MINKIMFYSVRKNVKRKSSVFQLNILLFLNFLVQMDLDKEIRLDKNLNSDSIGSEVKKEQYKSFLSYASHPNYCLLTFIFKILSIVAFFLLYFLLGQAIITFNVIIVLVSIDFWIVKNITGRILVGLRWWTDIDQNNQEIWIFESCDAERKINDFDSNCFWISILLFTLFWLAICIMHIVLLNFFSLWFLLSVICLILSMANISGFYKCKGEHQKKLKLYATKFGLQYIFNKEEQ